MTWVVRLRFKAKKAEVCGVGTDFVSLWDELQIVLGVPVDRCEFEWFDENSDDF